MPGICAASFRKEVAMMQRHQTTQRKNLTESVGPNMKCLKKLLKKRQPGMAQDEQIQQLAQNIRNCVKMDLQLTCFENAFQQTIQRYESQQAEASANKEHFDFELMVQSIFKNEELFIEDRMATHKWAKDLKKMMDKAKADDQDDGDLIEVPQEGQAAFPEKCPINFLPFKDPLKNPSCGHCFSKAGINALFKQNPGKTSIDCPTAGCKKKLQKGSLVPDEDFIQHLLELERMEAARARSQAAELDSESDEGL